MKHTFSVTVSRGLEDVLATELRRMGLQKVKPERGTVRFIGPLSDGLRACLWCRTGSRVLLQIARFQSNHPDDLYEALRVMPWEEHLAPDGLLWVDFVGTSKDIRNSQYGARLTKDAIVDRLRTPSGIRPGVDRDDADVRIHVHLKHSVYTVSIDLSGAALHWRTPRRRMTEAPLKENLAASLLMLMDWPKRASEGQPLIDPLCGSGTIVQEGAAIAANLPPGRFRRHWGFSRWRGHDPAAWRALIDEARQQQVRAPSLIIGSDHDPEAVATARYNCQQLGLSNLTIRRRALSDLAPPDDAPPGLLVTNPPYGERIGDERVGDLYRQLGDLLRQRMLGYSAGILAPVGPLSKAIGLRTDQRHILHNGPLECRFLTLEISQEAPRVY
jgi:23S rRNA (guanine2445-N2)-methyltransferase / 23S rRNA (guanine2069-N7)-methyltransferase